MIKSYIELKSASIALKWYLHHFYKEIETNILIASGTLNILVIAKLKLIDKRNTEIVYDINFKNLFAKKRSAIFDVSPNYHQNTEI
jgi:hypothetical protein